MTTTDTRSTKELFRQWRTGDAEAGQVMAQRFADWYYAIATSRLGERAGREPCERACAEFAKGIVQQTDARVLVTWAHNLIASEVKAGGGRRTGDEASLYSANQSPTQLLIQARRHLALELRVLEGCYRGVNDVEVARLAEPLGGMPLGLLKARYRVKQWLRDNARAPLSVAPDSPVLDRAPLPLYESGRMASSEEETNFEQWMLSDLDLCKDIAEFAPFAVALRGGLPLGARQESQAQKSPMPEEDPESDVGRSPSMALGGVAVAMTILAGVVLVVGLGIVLAVHFLAG